MPASGPAGTAVTIAGTNFGTATAVTFGDSAAAFTAESDSVIVTSVPAGVVTGPIVVTNPDGAASGPADFVVIQPPVIASFVPASGPAGTPVTVTGTGFTGVTSVTFADSAAAFAGDDPSRSRLLSVSRYRETIFERFQAPNSALRGGLSLGVVVARSSRKAVALARSRSSSLS